VWTYCDVSRPGSSIPALSIGANYFGIVPSGGSLSVFGKLGVSFVVLRGSGFQLRESVKSVEKLPACFISRFLKKFSSLP